MRGIGDEVGVDVALEVVEEPRAVAPPFPGSRKSSRAVKRSAEHIREEVLDFDGQRDPVSQRIILWRRRPARHFSGYLFAPRGSTVSGRHEWMVARSLPL